jgi:sterol 24-C-methyltransferase
MPTTPPGRASSATSSAPASRHLEQVLHYYRTPESRLLYRLLGGTKHYGYFRPGDPAWDIPAALRRMEDLLAQRLTLTAGSRVLDAGCGVGDVASRLGEVHGLHVTGIDFQGQDVEEARRRATRRRLGDQLEFHQMDYAALTFADGSFDGAYTLETLVHSDDVERVLAGLYRVLRPGGRLVHFEYSRSPKDRTSDYDEQFMTEINQVAAMPAFQRLEHGVLEQLLTDAGFVDVQSQDITARMLPMLKVFATAGWLPYLAGAVAGRTDLVVNSMAGVEFFLHRDCWRYNVYSCRKPD